MPPLGICRNRRAEAYNGLGPSSSPYSPECVEGEFSEVRPRSRHLADAPAAPCLLPWMRCTTRRGRSPRPVGGAGGQRERFDNNGPLGGSFHPGCRRPLRPLRAPQPPPRPVVGLVLCWDLLGAALLTA